MTGHEPPTRRQLLVRLLLGVVFIGFAAFWIWALFFASKEAINKVGDREWAVRAEQICAEADRERLKLTDLRPVTEAGPDAVRERADIIDRATDILERMLDDVVAVEPTDEKGRAIVPMWEADYRAWLEARRAFADDLRRTGENTPFYEPAVDNIPISEKIATFAGDNRMPACAPPDDLTR